MNKYKVKFDKGQRNLNYKCPVCEKQIRPTDGAWYVNSYIVCSEPCVNTYILQHMDDKEVVTWEHEVISRMAKEIQVGIDDLIVKDLLTKASK